MSDLVPVGGMAELALDLWWALRLEDGRTWGECAADFQKQDAEALFADTGPRLHFLTRPRGGSKTTDIAAMALTAAAVVMPARSHGYVVATNDFTGQEVVDAAGSLVYRTPELQGVISIENSKIIGPNGAFVQVLPLSPQAVWGKRDTHLIICDEFAQWPETTAARRVWTALRTTVQKTPGCRLVILTSAGEPSHSSYQVRKAALADREGWRVHEVPGPVPWQDPTELARLRTELLPSQYDRLILNEWTEAEDRAITEADYDRAAERSVEFGMLPAGLKGGGWRLHHCRKTDPPGYVLTVDVGTRNDATVMCVAHKEPLTDDPYGPQKVVVDHLERWQGSKRQHVDLEQVTNRVIQLGHEYNRAKVYADPDQFVGDLQRINRAGLQAQEWPFTSTSVGQVATALVQTFRNGQIKIPDNPDLREELLQVKLRESAPGVTRLDHDKDKHDDQAVVIGMACHLLIAGMWGQGQAFLETWRTEVTETVTAPKPSLPAPSPRDFFFTPAAAQPSAGEARCDRPRYFGPERLCTNCGRDPEAHQKEPEPV